MIDYDRCPDCNDIWTRCPHCEYDFCNNCGRLESEVDWDAFEESEEGS